MIGSWEGGGKGKKKKKGQLGGGEKVVDYAALHF